MGPTGPHIVILGAGATIAAIPNGDKYGNKCSVMNNFIDNMGLQSILDNYGISTESNNLEVIFSVVDLQENSESIRKELEDAIEFKIKQYVIPDKPTAYDYLLMSLRGKDYVFTFNWDDLLIQAYTRIKHKYKDVDLPKMFFLHGNIGVGFCKNCLTQTQLSNKRCPKCTSELARPKLLFPVKNKDYESDPYISGAWDIFRQALMDAKYLTIFGYSAPVSDSAAIKIMKDSFSSSSKLMQAIDIVDVDDRVHLYTKWDPFIVDVHEHVNIYNDIKDSILGQFPRRSIEGYIKVFHEGWWGESSIQLKEVDSIAELYKLVKPLIDNENNDDHSVF